MEKISFSTGGLYPRLSIDALGLLENAGYSLAEFMPQCTYETTPDFAKEVKKLNIKIDSIHYPLVFFGILYNQYPGMVIESKKLTDNLVDMGTEMESRVIVIHPEVSGGTIVPEVLESLNYLCEVSEKAGIQIVLENHPKGGNTPEQLTAAAELIGYKNMRYMMDVTESWECDVDPMEFVEKLNLDHLHLSDFSKKGKHQPPGEGDIKWKEIFAALKKKNYIGTYCIEPMWPYYKEDAAEKLITARKFIESCL